MIKGAIFDLDGTLLNSMFVWNTVGENYLRSIGLEPDKDINETFKAMSPVSYTHRMDTLDQLLIESLDSAEKTYEATVTVTLINDGDAWVVQESDELSNALTGGMLDFANSASTVSYTHLDVYKRQGLMTETEYKVITNTSLK